MMNRILSGLLALLMVVSIFPASAFAEDTTATTAATTEATTAPACDTCGNYDCGSDHLTWCVICRKDDCGEDHVSAANLEPCTTCGSTECDGSHENWCADCKQDNCGVDHTVPKPCATCGSTECDGSHENWCANCKKDNCGVDHTRIPETSTGPKNVGEKNHPMVGKIVKLTAQAQYPTAIEDPNNAFNTGSLIRAEAYPEHMEIEAVITVGSTVYYQLKAATGYAWPDYVMDLNAGTTKNFAHYWIKSDSVEEVQPEAPAEAEQSEVTLEKTTESGQKISMTGVVPQGTRLSAQDVTMSATYGSARSETRILATLDIKLLDADGKEYQPYTDGGYVQIDLDAAEMGLSDGDIVKLHHQHGDTVDTYEYVVINGKITYYTDKFSIFIVEKELDTGNSPNAQKINSGSTIQMTVGDPSKVFYTSGSDDEFPASVYEQGNNGWWYTYTNYKFYVWSVSDENDAVDYSVRNWNGQTAGNLVAGFDARIAPWISITPKRAGTVHLTVKSYYQGWNNNASPQHSSTTTKLSEETLTIVVSDPVNEFYIKNQIPENGTLVPAGLGNIAGVTYTWSRSDKKAIYVEALNNDGSVNIAKDRGGIVNDSTKSLGTSDPIIYTVTATLPNGTTYTASYEVTYGNEILNPSFEVPDDAKNNWSPPWGGTYGYITNGAPGVHWKTTSPGDYHNIGRDLEFGSASSPHGAVPVDGSQYVELNAENYGALYQDILTSPGATLSWGFSHSARNGAPNNNMYVVLGATKDAQDIIDYTDIRNLISYAKSLETNGMTIPKGGEGFRIVYNGEIYYIWNSWTNVVANSVSQWVTISGTYTIPQNQYLTRLFFVSDPTLANGDSTMGNLIDAVSAGEYMDYIVEYYETQTLATEKIETGEDVKAYTTVDLKNLQAFLDEYEYPFKILVNGKPYSGTVEDLKRGLYMIDYGTKVNGAADGKYNAYDTVVQIYFQVPNVRVTKTVRINDWAALSAAKKQELLNRGLQAEFLMQNDNAATDQYKASVSITQQGTDGSLSASTSFPIDQEVYGKPYTVTETSATQIDGYEMVTTITNDTFTLDENDGPHVVNVAVTNTYYPRGDLKVTKYVAKQSEADADPDPNQEFTFTVTLPEDPIPRTKFPYQIYNGGEIEDTTDDTPVDDSVKQLSAIEGKLTFALKHNQYIVIENLPVGVVTITEAETAGFVQQFDQPSYRITTGETENAVCINYVERTSGNLEITKKVVNLGNGTVPTPANGYKLNVVLNPYAADTVTVTYTRANGTTEERSVDVNDGAFSVYLYDGDKATINNIPSASYTITEEAYSDFGVAWSGAGNAGVINGGKTAAVTCTNTYPVNSGDLRIVKQVNKAYDRDTVPADHYTIQVNFKKDNVALSADQKFAYKIYNKNDNPATVTAQSSGQIASGGTLQLKDGQFAIIKDIPCCNFEITETAATSGLSNYEVKYNYGQGKVIISGQEVTADVVNTYKRHLGTITIKKYMFINSRYDGQPFLFRITGPNGFSMSISLNPEETEVIYDLPLGKYTITEDLSWSWRYNYVGSDTATVDLNKEPDSYATFTNKWIEDKWLNDTGVKENKFTASSPGNS